MPDIFISYERGDRDKAKALAEYFILKGYDVWWDSDLLAGQEFAAEIEAVINKAKVTIVLWTPKSVQSHWVKSEAQMSLKRNILVPVFLEPTEIPLPFNTLHTIDLGNWNGRSDDSILDNLYHDIKILTGEPVDQAEIPTENQLRNKLEIPKEEIDYWKSIQNEQSVSQYGSKQYIHNYMQYIEKYGEDGAFTSIAKSKIAEIKKQKTEKLLRGAIAVFFVMIAVYGAFLVYQNSVDSGLENAQNTQSREDQDSELENTQFPDLKVPSLTITTEPSSGEVFKGETFTVYWESESAEKVTLNGVDVDIEGKKTFNPEVTTTYHFDATSKADLHKEETVTVTIKPPILWTKNEIMKVQCILNQYLKLNLSEDGHKGMKTDDAIREYRKLKGLPETGGLTPELIKSIKNDDNRPSGSTCPKHKSITISPKKEIYPNLDITVEPSSLKVKQGNPVILNWTTSDAKSVTLNGEQVSLAGKHQPELSKTTTFTFVATSQTGHVKTEAMTITVEKGFSPGGVSM